MNLKDKINYLKKEKNALILAHYYERADVQEIADFVGDSYFLSKKAKESSKNKIIFCGVKFMAESAKILSPEKTILLPAYDATCPMAEMASPEKVLNLKNQYPNAAVVCYINSTTEVKALCDVVVTSSNAYKIINKLPNDEIIFLPDKNLGSFLQEKIPNKKFILWNGFCITHKKISSEDIVKIKELKPDLKVLVHPECEKNVRALASFIGSTGDIIKYASDSDSNEFLICTEEGVLTELKHKNPNKTFYVPGKTTLCPNMKKTTLLNVLNSLENNDFEINVPEDLRIKAEKSLLKMHELAR